MYKRLRPTTSAKPHCLHPFERYIITLNSHCVKSEMYYFYASNEGLAANRCRSQKQQSPELNIIEINCFSNLFGLKCSYLEIGESRTSLELLFARN